MRKLVIPNRDFLFLPKNAFEKRNDLFLVITLSRKYKIAEKLAAEIRLASNAGADVFGYYAKLTYQISALKKIGAILAQSLAPG